MPQQTPKWADKEKIRTIYKRAKRLGKVVDHIIPLKGKTVSGLHVHNNLRVVTRHTNAKKGNKYEECDSIS